MPHTQDLQQALIKAGYQSVETLPGMEPYDVVLQPAKLRDAAGDWPAVGVLHEQGYECASIHELGVELVLHGVQNEITMDVDVVAAEAVDE